MNPEFETMRLEVPYYQAAAMLMLPRGERRLLSLRLDTVFISTASQSCEFLFRTNTPFDRRDWDQSILTGTIHPLGVPFVFPDRLDPTGGVDDNAHNRPRTLQGTEILEPKGAAGEYGSLADFKPHSEPPPTAVLAQEQKFSSTVVVELEAAPPSMPFAARTRARPTRSVEAPPGSPWARPTATSAPPPEFIEPADPLGATVNLPDGPAKPTIIEPMPEALPKREQPIPELSRPEPPELPKQPPSKAKPLWREDPAAPVPSRVTPPPPAPKADLSKHLYKKIKR
jgi:hypothetical protein